MRTSCDGIDPGAQLVQPEARVQRHHHFFERAIAGALADAVDGHLRLPRARAQSGERVCGREAEIVVAVHAEAITPSRLGTFATIPAMSAPNSSGTV